MKQYQVDFTDSSTGATSPIDTITAPEGYTAADYLRDCQDNADQDYIEMLEGGQIELVEIEE